MGLSSVAGAVLGKPVEGLVTGIGNIIDELHTSGEEKLDRKILMERVRQEPELMEIAERIAQAGHPSVFVAGGRPFVIWASGVGIAWNTIAVSLLNWVGMMLSPETFMAIPHLDWNELMVLAGLAGGASWVRHMDKVRGVARHNLGDLQ